MAIETTTLGGGCFWCLEAAYQQIKGVRQVESGYMGGQTKQPGYAEVSQGTTGHAEVVRLTFDTDVVTFRELLEIFFTLHDPTTMNRQGADTGTQYRSVIFFETSLQEATARNVIAEMANVWDAPIVTQLLPAQPFYRAEDYHQDYFRQHPLQGYCALIVAPKLSKLKEIFHDKLK